jgi:hypothetical protein
MLKRGLFNSAKFVLITIVSILGVTVSHVAVTSAAAPTNMNMMSHGTQSSVQCQSSCTTTLPTKKEEELLQVKEDDKDPVPQTYYALLLSGVTLAALFVVKRSASFTSSWRPPDLLKLYGHYILYA